MAKGAEIVAMFGGSPGVSTFDEAIEKRGYALGSDSTEKDSGRQWNDDAGKDLKWRLISDFHELSKDEAEAQARPAEVFEGDNKYLTPKIRAVLFFAKRQEALHEELYNAVAKTLEEDNEEVLDATLDLVRDKTEALVDELEADAQYGKDIEEED